MNQEIVKEVIETLIHKGISHFCLCPGGRNSPFVYHLALYKGIHLYHWPEERSAAFFALGKIKTLGQPVAIITTSGTAAAELLPALVEAHYSGLALIAITADRPRRFRASGAPQSIEQVGLFGCYVEKAYDVAGQEKCSFKEWSGKGSLHINVCLEEPKEAHSSLICHPKSREGSVWKKPSHPSYTSGAFEKFASKVRFPLVVVGALPKNIQKEAADFLLRFWVPTLFEAPSGLREKKEFEAIRISGFETIWEEAKKAGYPIDGVLRIGSIPTTRLWREIEERKKEIDVCSISTLAFSGLSEKEIEPCCLSSFFNAVKKSTFKKYPFEGLIERSKQRESRLLELYEEEPLAEPSLIHALSKQIAPFSHIYLGNSLPIREWDLAAAYQDKAFRIEVSRGANGIDGQLSCFFGSCTKEEENWGIFGDLTAIYDLASFWIVPQLLETTFRLVVINNQGAGIFRKMYSHPGFVHSHGLSFKGIADFWQIDYEKWTTIPKILPQKKQVLIELCPDLEATERFWKKI